MAYTFLKAKGESVGRSLVEDDKKDVALRILAKAAERGVGFRLPLDHVLATAVDASAETRVVEGTPFPPDLAERIPEFKQYGEALANPRALR